MNWHNITELKPAPLQKVTIFTKEGEKIPDQEWREMTQKFMPSGLGVEDAVWWELSTELSTGEE